MDLSRTQKSYIKAYYRRFADVKLAKALGVGVQAVEETLKGLALIRSRKEKTWIKSHGRAEAPLPEVAGQVALPREAVRLGTMDFLLAYATAMAALGVYVLTLGPTVTGEDSGELITAAYTLGIAHPPGYPLWTLLAKAFTYIPVGSVAWRVNFMSACFAAGTVFIVCLLVLKLTGKSKASKVAACGAGLALAFSAEFWEQSVIAEVYTLNAFLVALSIFLLHHWYEWRRPSSLYYFAFVYGLGLCNHQTMLLLGPVFVLFLLAIDWKPWFRWPMYGGMGLLTVAALAIYIYLPVRSAADPPTDWGNPESWGNFWDVIRLKQYAFTFSEQPRTFTLFLEQVWAFLKLYLWEFTPWMAWAPVAGIMFLWKRSRLISGLFVVMLGLLTVGLILLRNFELDKEGLWVSNVFWIPAYMLCAVLMGVAFHGISAAKWKGRGLFWPAMVLAAVAAASPLLVHYERNDKSDYYWAYDYGRNVLRTMEEGAIYFPTADHATFPVMYLQAVEGLRPDVTIANKYGYPEEAIYADMPEEIRRGFRKIPTAGETLIIEDWVIAHSDRPVYFTKKRPVQAPPGARMANAGLLYRVVRPGEDWSGEDLWSDYEWHTLEPEKTRGELTAEFVLADYHFAEGRARLSQGRIEEGLKAFDTALSVAGETKETLNNLGSACAEYGAFDAATHFFAKSLELDARYILGLRNLGKVYVQTGAYVQGLKVFDALLEQEPRDYEGHRLSAQCLANLDRPDSAIGRLQRLLQWYPDDDKVYREIGMLYLNEKGDSVNAIRFFSQSLSLNPNQPDLSMMIAQQSRPNASQPPVPGVPQPGAAPDFPRARVPNLPNVPRP